MTKPGVSGRFYAGIMNGCLIEAVAAAAIWLLVSLIF